jgi:hypothetical protein
MFRTLYPRTIWLIFISLSVIFLSLGYFKYWSPNQEEAKYNVDQANLLYSEGAKLGQAVKKKNSAVESVKLAERKWLPIVDTKTPIADTARGGINVNVNRLQLLLDTKRFRNSVQRALNHQLLVGGVKQVIGPRVPGVTDQDEPNNLLASYYNYPGVPFPVVIYDLGQVTVKGTYEQIMKNVRSWENFPRYLAVAHGLQLTGTAPTLTGTYNLTIVGYIRYDGLFGPVPAVSSSGTSGGGQGAPAGGPGGGNGRVGGAGAPGGGFGGPGAAGGPPGPQIGGVVGAGGK